MKKIKWILLLLFSGISMTFSIILATMLVSAIQIIPIERTMIIGIIAILLMVLGIVLYYKALKDSFLGKVEHGLD
jgi:hypothetical protein